MYQSKNRVHISIITPSYNGEVHIEGCIQNVIAQRCPNVEHLIIDGNSQDRTVEIIRHYADKYSHIRWISEIDKGQSDALNKGLRLAKGEIIGILNVDDYYEPDVLNRILDQFKHLSEPAFIAGNCNVWDQIGNLVYVNKPSKLKLEELLLGFQVNQYPVNPSAYFYHASLHQKVGFYDEKEDYVMDLDFIFRAVQRAKCIYIDETWGNFRVLEDTKTYSDQAANRSGYRKKQMIKKFRNDLPFPVRILVILRYHYYDYFYKLVRAYKNPRKIAKYIPFLQGL